MGFFSSLGGIISGLFGGSSKSDAQIKVMQQQMQQQNQQHQQMMQQMQMQQINNSKNKESSPNMMIILGVAVLGGFFLMKK